MVIRTQMERVNVGDTATGILRFDISPGKKIFLHSLTFEGNVTLNADGDYVVIGVCKNEITSLPAAHGAGVINYRKINAEGAAYIFDSHMEIDFHNRAIPDGKFWAFIYCNGCVFEAIVTLQYSKDEDDYR